LTSASASDYGSCSPDRTAKTVRFANLAGLKNGKLLDAAEAADFDVLITVDQNIPDQQNLTGRRISLGILCGPTNAFAI
jgi:hypothetical protein